MERPRPGRGMATRAMSTTTGTLRMRFTTEDLLTTRARLSHDLDPGEFGWPATPYTRALGEGDREAMNVLVHAIESYYHAVIEPRWPLVQRTAAAGHDSVHRRMGEAGHVLGRTRTMILVRLNNACTTTGLAEGLSMSPATASRQVGLPRRAGFVLSVRKGRSTVYMLSPYGRSIVEA